MIRKIFSFGVIALCISLCLSSCEKAELFPYNSTHEIVIEQSGDIDAFDLDAKFIALSAHEMFDDNGKSMGNTLYDEHNIKKSKYTCKATDASGLSVDIYINEHTTYLDSYPWGKVCPDPGKKIKITVTAYINGKKVDQLLPQEFETPLQREIHFDFNTWDYVGRQLY